MFCARHFFVTISLDVTISASCNWSVAVFTTSLESQESYLTLRNVTLQTRLSITQDFFRQHSTFARLYHAAASPASRLRSAGSLAIIIYAQSWRYTHKWWNSTQDSILKILNKQVSSWVPLLSSLFFWVWSRLLLDWLIFSKNTLDKWNAILSCCTGKTK